MNIRINKLQTPDSVLDECVIVIDVLRAFTTAAFAFSVGAAKIIPVSTVDEAFSIKSRLSNSLLMGEVGGLPIPGFDFGNSPTEIKKLDLTGKIIIQRTSAGTQGVVRSIHSKKILVSSFVVAEATLQRIQTISPKNLSFVITGQMNGDEDFALADYIESKIHRQTNVDPEPFLKRVIDSPEGQYFSSSNDPRLPRDDLHLAITLDLFQFTMEVIKEKDLPVIYPVNQFGTVLHHSKINKTLDLSA